MPPTPPNFAGRVSHHIRVFSDISALKETQRKLDALAATDPLTGLDNRRTFHQRAPQGPCD